MSDSNGEQGNKLGITDRELTDFLSGFGEFADEDNEEKDTFELSEEEQRELLEQLGGEVSRHDSAHTPPRPPSCEKDPVQTQRIGGYIAELQKEPTGSGIKAMPDDKSEELPISPAKRTEPPVLMRTPSVDSLIREVPQTTESALIRILDTEPTKSSQTPTGPISPVCGKSGLFPFPEAAPQEDGADLFDTGKLSISTLIDNYEKLFLSPEKAKNTAKHISGLYRMLLTRIACARQEIQAELISTCIEKTAWIESEIFSLRDAKTLNSLIGAFEMLEQAPIAQSADINIFPGNVVYWNALVAQIPNFLNKLRLRVKNISKAKEDPKGAFAQSLLSAANVAHPEKSIRIALSEYVESKRLSALGNRFSGKSYDDVVKNLQDSVEAEVRKGNLPESEASEKLEDEIEKLDCAMVEIVFDITQIMATNADNPKFIRSIRSVAFNDFESEYFFSEDHYQKPLHVLRVSTGLKIYNDLSSILNLWSQTENLDDKDTLFSQLSRVAEFYRNNNLREDTKVLILETISELMSLCADDEDKELLLKLAGLFQEFDMEEKDAVSAKSLSTVQFSLLKASKMQSIDPAQLEDIASEVFYALENGVPKDKVLECLHDFVDGQLLAPCDAAKLFFDDMAKYLRTIDTSTEYGIDSLKFKWRNRYLMAIKSVLPEMLKRWKKTKSADEKAGIIDELSVLAEYQSTHGKEASPWVIDACREMLKSHKEDGVKHPAYIEARLLAVLRESEISQVAYKTIKNMSGLDSALYEFCVADDFSKGGAGKFERIVCESICSGVSADYTKERIERFLAAYDYELSAGAKEFLRNFNYNKFLDDYLIERNFQLRQLFHRILRETNLRKVFPEERGEFLASIEESVKIFSVYGKGRRNENSACDTLIDGVLGLAKNDGKFAEAVLDKISLYDPSLGILISNRIREEDRKRAEEKKKSSFLGRLRSNSLARKVGGTIAAAGLIGVSLWGALKGDNAEKTEVLNEGARSETSSTEKAGEPKGQVLFSGEKSGATESGSEKSAFAQAQMLIEDSRAEADREKVRVEEKIEAEKKRAKARELARKSAGEALSASLSGVFDGALRVAVSEDVSVVKLSLPRGKEVSVDLATLLKWHKPLAGEKGPLEPWEFTAESGDYGFRIVDDLVRQSGMAGELSEYWMFKMTPKLNYWHVLAALRLKNPQYRSVDPKLIRTGEVFEMGGEHGAAWELFSTLYKFSSRKDRDWAKEYLASGGDVRVVLQLVNDGAIRVKLRKEIREMADEFRGKVAGNLVIEETADGQTVVSLMSDLFDNSAGADADEIDDASWGADADALPGAEDVDAVWGQMLNDDLSLVADAGADADALPGAEDVDAVWGQMLNDDAGLDSGEFEMPDFTGKIAELVDSKFKDIAQAKALDKINSFSDQMVANARAREAQRKMDRINALSDQMLANAKAREAQRKMDRG